MSPLLELILVCSFLYYMRTVLYLGYYLSNQKKYHSKKLITVSIVVAARNEAGNLETCLQCLTTQNYPQKLMEIIIVDDRSADATTEILNTWSQSFHIIKTVRIDKSPLGVGPKKYAITQGIKNSTGDLLLFTDADCRPQRNWVKGIVSYFERNIGLVCGFAPLKAEQSKVLPKILEFDAFTAACVAAAGVFAGKPITCTGRNLAYRRRVYDELDGFALIEKSFAGDDDLFLHQVARKTQWGYTYALLPETYVASAPPTTFRTFIKQRRRHFSSSKYYPLNIKIVYFFTYLSNLILYSFLAQAIITTILLFPALLLFGLKILADSFILVKALKLFNHKQPIWIFPLWELFFVLSYSLIGPLSFLGRIKWR